MLEEYVLENGRKMNYHRIKINKRPRGCDIWKYKNASSVYKELTDYRKELNEYEALLQQHLNSSQQKDDLRLHLTDTDKSICDTLELHPQGLKGIFKNSNGLSQLKGSSGYVEPLIAPLRHPKVCFPTPEDKHIMNMGYLVHDFAAMCRHNLKPNSRTVFIDMGAALDFHGTEITPAVYITKMYQSFGFHFDHIYAYEVQQKDPNDVYSRIPNDLKAAYHWYNVGVNATVDHPNNPLHTILQKYNEDDFIIVKLDIDSPDIENPMAEFVANGGINNTLANLIDAFYFEHHVNLAEMAPYWKKTMRGSVQHSLQIFQQMRKIGIASHYWP
jgi:hypothetical protein